MPLAAAARGARAALGAAAGTLGPYLQQFLAAASAATAAGESHALLQRCEATLGSAAAQEQQLAAQAEEGRASVEGMLAAAQPLAAQLQACLRECQVGATPVLSGCRGEADTTSDMSKRCSFCADTAVVKLGPAGFAQQTLVLWATCVCVFGGGRGEGGPRL